MDLIANYGLEFLNHCLYNTVMVKFLYDWVPAILQVHADLMYTRIVSSIHLCTLYTRVSQYVSNLLFFKILIIRQAHIHLKVAKQSNFCRFLQNSKMEIENGTNFLQGPVQKLFEIESPFFAAMLIGSSTSKKYIIFTLIQNHILMILE